MVHDNNSLHCCFNYRHSFAIPSRKQQCTLVAKVQVFPKASSRPSKSRCYIVIMRNKLNTVWNNAWHLSHHLAVKWAQIWSKLIIIVHLFDCSMWNDYLKSQVNLIKTRIEAGLGPPDVYVIGHSLGAVMTQCVLKSEAWSCVLLEFILHICVYYYPWLNVSLIVVGIWLLLRRTQDWISLEYTLSPAPIPGGKMLGSTAKAQAAGRRDTSERSMLKAPHA